jgi:hypothetical protein
MRRHCGTSLCGPTLHAVKSTRPVCCHAVPATCIQAPRSYAQLANGYGSGDEADGDDAQEGTGSKKKPSKKAASKGSARQQLTGFEGCTHLFSDGDVYPAYQQGRCQAFHSGVLFPLPVIELCAHAMQQCWQF